MRHGLTVGVLGVSLVAACSGAGGAQTTTLSKDASIDAVDAHLSESTPPPTEGGTEAATMEAATCPIESPLTLTTAASNIQHVVIVVQENHSFDNYFGRYCTAPTGSSPTCNTGPSCCEAGPAKDPGTGDGPVEQDDENNGTYDPNHAQACELVEIDDGKMDQYVSAPSQAGNPCGSTYNYAYASAASAKTYWDLAGSYAIADNYFQSIAGQSSSNDMYLAAADYVFTDDMYEPQAIGSACEFDATMSFTGTTIGDLLVKASVPWGWYSESYALMLAAQKHGICPHDSACPGNVPFYPCVYDPDDVPFEYYPQFTDNPKYMFDYTKLACDVTAGALPAVAYVKPVGYKSEHPGLHTTMSAGEAFVSEVIETIESSPYAKNTLILVTWDESGGYFDHIAPPPNNAVDHQPYGPRIPLLAIGAMVKKNYVSHVQMEHASIVKFIEWNWLGPVTGQLGKRDMAVNNIGDMLDPAMTGTEVPAD